MSLLQDTNDEKINVAVKLPNKKSPAAKPPPKPAKEKAVKPKKEVVKPGKPVKPDPTVKAKVVGSQPGVVRGITYYKAAKSEDDEHRGGESFSVAPYCPSTACRKPHLSGFALWSLCDHLCVILCRC